MAVNLKNLITQNWKNLITNVLSNITNNSSTNVKSATVAQPNQYKTENPKYAQTKVSTPVQTPVSTPIKTTPVNTQYATPVNNTTPVTNNQSRFIWFQNNYWVQNQFTKQAQNVINWNTAQQNIQTAVNNEKNKVSITIPTAKQQNNANAQTYITQLKAVRDLQADMYKNNWPLNEQQLRTYYPEYSDKLNEIMDLQNNLRPIVRNGEYVDEAQIRDNYDNILHKQDIKSSKQLQKEATDLDNANKKIFNKANKVNLDQLSANGKQFASYMSQLSDIPRQLKQKYNFNSDATDSDIINYYLNNVPWAMDEYKKMVSLDLTSQDRARLWVPQNWVDYFNSFSIWISDAINSANQWYQWNVAQPLNDVPVVWAVAQTAWTALAGADKTLTNLGQLTNWEFNSMWEIASSGIKTLGWWMETAFWTAYLPATAGFNLLWQSEVWEKVLENTVWLVPRAITATFENTPVLKDFYNSLDDEAKADLANELTIALFQWAGAIGKKYWLDIKAWVASDAVVNALQRGKYASKFQIFVEKWLADEKTGKFQKGAVSRILKEWWKEFESALKENLSKFDEVVKARQEMRNPKPVDNNNLTDKRTTGEKVKSEIKNTAEAVKNKVSEVNDVIKEKYTNLIKRKSWNQEQQWQQWFSTTSEKGNLVNQPNSTQNLGEINTKPLNTAQSQLLANYNRMNPKAIDTFEEKFWEPYTQYLSERWFTKAWESNLNDMVTYQKDLMEIKENALNKIDWKFNDVAVSDMLDVLQDFYTKTKDRKNLAIIENLQNQHNNGWLSMAEINKARKKFQYDIRTNFFKDWNSEKIQLANNVYLAVKDFLDKTAKENWLDSLDEINREIMKVQHIIWWVTYKMRWSSANNTLWLTDYITLASMLNNPAWMAVFLWKQALKSNAVRDFVLEKAIGRRWNAKNRITADKMASELDRIAEINDEKARNKALEQFYNTYIKPVKELSEYFDNSIEEFKRQFNESVEEWTLDNALPDKRNPADEWKNVITGKNQVTIEVDEQGNSRRKGQISESDKRSEENKKEWYVKSEPEPKNIVTAKPKEEVKTKEEPKKPEVKKKKEVKPKNEVTTKQPVKEAPAEKTEWMVTVYAGKGKIKEVPLSEVTKRWVDLDWIDLKQIQPENVDDIIRKAEWWYKFYKDSHDGEFIQALGKNWELVMSYWYWPEYVKLFQRIADKWNKENKTAVKETKNEVTTTKKEKKTPSKSSKWEKYEFTPFYKSDFEINLDNSIRIENEIDNKDNMPHLEREWYYLTVDWNNALNSKWKLETSSFWAVHLLLESLLPNVKKWSNIWIAKVENWEIVWEWKRDEQWLTKGWHVYTTYKNKSPKVEPKTENKQTTEEIDKKFNEELEQWKKEADKEAVDLREQFQAKLRKELWLPEWAELNRSVYESLTPEQIKKVKKLEAEYQKAVEKLNKWKETWWVKVTPKKPNTPKNWITAKKDDTDVNGKFRNLTAEEYRTMKEFDGLEDLYLKWDIDTIKWMKILQDTMGYFKPDEDFWLPADYSLNYHKWYTYTNAKDIIELQNLLEEVRKWEVSKSMMDEYWEDYFKNGKWDTVAIKETQADLLYEILENTAEDFNDWNWALTLETFIDQFDDNYWDTKYNERYTKEAEKLAEKMGWIYEKYWEYWRQGERNWMGWFVNTAPKADRLEIINRKNALTNTLPEYEYEEIAPEAEKYLFNMNEEAESQYNLNTMDFEDQSSFIDELNRAEVQKEIDKQQEDLKNMPETEDVEALDKVTSNDKNKITSEWTNLDKAIKSVKNADVSKPQQWYIWEDTFVRATSSDVVIRTKWDSDFNNVSFYRKALSLNEMAQNDTMFIVLNDVWEKGIRNVNKVLEWLDLQYRVWSELNNRWDTVYFLENKNTWHKDYFSDEWRSEPAISKWLRDKTIVPRMTPEQQAEYNKQVEKMRAEREEERRKEEERNKQRQAEEEQKKAVEAERLKTVDKFANNQFPESPLQRWRIMRELTENNEDSNHKVYYYWDEVPENAEVWQVLDALAKFNWKISETWESWDKYSYSYDYWDNWHISRLTKTQKDYLEYRMKDIPQSNNLQNYLDSIDNKSLKTRAENTLWKRSKMRIDDWRIVDWTRAEWIQYLLDGWRKPKEFPTGKTYPNWTPRVEYMIVNDKNVWAFVNKIEYDYARSLLEKWEETPKENSVTTEEENHLFKKWDDNLIKDTKNYKFDDFKNASIDDMLVTDWFEKYRYEEDWHTWEWYAGYINWKAVDIIPDKENDIIRINVWDELMRSYDDSSINVQLKDSDNIISVVAPYDDAGFKSVLARVLWEKAPELWKPSEIIYKKWEWVFEVYDDIWTLRMNARPWDKLLSRDWTVYDLWKEFNNSESRDWKLYYANTSNPNSKIESRDYFDGKDIIWISKWWKKHTDIESQKAVISEMSNLSELNNILENKKTSYEWEIWWTPVKVEALNSNYDRLNVDYLDNAVWSDRVSKYELTTNKDPYSAKFYETFDELKSDLKSLVNWEDIWPKNAITNKAEVKQPKNLVTNPNQEVVKPSEWKIQEIDEDTFFNDIGKNTKDHKREMFIYKKWDYFYPKFILPSWKVLVPENTYWGEVRSEDIAREWLKGRAEEYSEANEAKKSAKLKELWDKIAEKYEETLKRIESDNPMYEIRTHWDYFKYGMKDSQVNKARKEADANAEVWTFKKDVIDWKEWYRIFVSWNKQDALRAFYEPKTWKTYRIYKWPVLDESRPFTTNQVNRIEKFLWNVEKQLEKETKKEKVEKKPDVTQEWLDSLKPDKDGIVDLDPKWWQYYALVQWKEPLVKEWKADWKYLRNYWWESRPQYDAVYVKDWVSYEWRKWLDNQYMTTRQEAVDWLNQKEKDVEHEATARYNERDYEPLPKTISVEAEAEKAWPKRIAPDRVKWQQETYDKWLENVKEIVKASPFKIYELWFKSDRSKAVQDIMSERKRIRELPESEADIQWNELARSIYEDLVIKDISKWYRYPEDVTSKFPKAQMKKAVDARARYEKWLFTSFSSKDTRANYQYKDEIWAWIKSQDWKPVTQEQMSEIVDGIRSFGKVFWLDMKKFAEDNNIIYVHLHGWNPFLMWWMKIAWLYRRWEDWNISVSLWWVEWVMEKWEDWEMKKTNINATPEHELAHAVDYMLDNKLFSSPDIEILKKTMNKPEHLINYYNRSQEIVARAVEQYSASITWKDRYGKPYVNSQAYWNQENFDKYVKPIVEKNMNSKLEDYKLNKSESKNEVTANSKNEVTASPKNEVINKKSSVVNDAMEKIEPLVKKMRSLNSVQKNMWMMMTEKEKEAMRNSWKKARQDIVDILMESGKENRNTIIRRIHDIDTWIWMDFDEYVILDDEEPKNAITRGK